LIALMFVEGGRVQARLRAPPSRPQRLDAADRRELSWARRKSKSGMLLARASPAEGVARRGDRCVLQPARSVGGDLYDAFHDRPRPHLGFLVGDVTGKAWPASLFIGAVKALFLAPSWPDPGSTWRRPVDDINAELSRDNGQMMAVSVAGRRAGTSPTAGSTSAAPATRSAYRGGRRGGAGAPPRRRPGRSARPRFSLTVGDRTAWPPGETLVVLHRRG